MLYAYTHDMHDKIQVQRTGYGLCPGYDGTGPIVWRSNAAIQIPFKIQPKLG